MTSAQVDVSRRPSMKLTDFPTEVERPSLPVTPAPIRRPSFWGEERDELGNLPTAEGVPKQEDWVRRFSSYPAPVFLDLPPPLHDLRGDLYWRCQFCGQQNPVMKLEELQRRQSEVLMSPTETRQLGDAADPPTRKMPESASREAAIEAAVLAMSPTETPKVPKPILKAPSFELGREPESSPERKSEAGHINGPSFNPVMLVGEAATESKAAGAASAVSAASA